MGIIQRQGAKNSFISFVGVTIGAISMIFIYSHNKDIYGYAQWLYSTALLFITISSLGVVSLVTKFYPSFKSEDNKDFGFLWLIIGFYFMAFLSFCFVSFLFKDQVYQFLIWAGIDKQARIQDNIHFILPLCFLLGLNLILSNQSANFKRIVVPEIFNNLSYKIVLPSLVLLFAAGYLVQANLAVLILVFFALVSFLLFGYLGFIGGLNLRFPDFSLLSRSMKSKMANYSIFGVLSMLGAALAFRVDIIMIGTMLGFEAVGLYSILLFLSNVIEVPTKSISKIASPIIAEALEEKNIEEIKMIYKKSSLNLLLVGIPIFILIWFSLADLESLSGSNKTFYEGRYIFLFLGIAKIIDMAAGLNGQIIIYSKYYRFNLYFLLILAVINVILNYFLISQFGLIGAAIATFVAFSCFNLLKYILIYYKYKIQPFSPTTLKVLASCTIVFILISFVPYFDLAPINAVIAGLVLVSVYLPIIYFFKLSEDAIQAIKYILVFLKLKKL